MKKVVKYLVFIFITSFVFTIGVNADVKIKNACEMSHDNTYQDCKVSLVIDSSKVNKVTMHFDLINLTFDNYETLDDNFKIALDKTALTLRYDVEQKKFGRAQRFPKWTTNP